ncbi:MAG: hypothetical protein JNK84_06225 [Phreatobacter sp.]|uniref:hypothetical protein n=1 Tax=Phreatobacter sp. TaxID=1966341 RepID=UPI001A54CE8A|nr:hypothetical protein [Phreatobacter sp.]MBL8568665.1 hypothetical protein [Phreatobacter sp.]
MNRPDRAGRRRLIGSVAAAATIAVLSGWASAFSDNLSGARVIPPPETALPGYLQPSRDPAFGTPYTRITDPGATLGAGIACGRDMCRHRYSSAQAWNADQSLLLIPIGCSGMCFFDGRTYEPLFRRARFGECEWHPLRPEAMICVTPSAVLIWEPKTAREEVLYRAAGYRDLKFGPYKGNPSNDGRWIAVRALAPSGEEVVFAFDLVERRKKPDISLNGLPGKTNACTISPLGLHVACIQNAPDGTDQGFIFSRDGDLVQRWSEHHRPGHGDMTVDADGSEVYVGISKAPPDRYFIIKRRLVDGAVTVLAPTGEGQHASLRSIGRPGWVFVTYSGDPEAVARRPGWAPFAREVIALKIDGSGEFRRVVHTHSVRHNYWNEAQASPSPDGTQIMWASNWNRPGGPIHTFVARLDWPTRAATSESVMEPQR